MLQIFKHIGKRNFGLFILSIFLIYGQVWFELKLPDYMSKITMVIQQNKGSIEPVLQAGGRMLLCALGSLAMAVCVTFISARIASDFSASLRSQIFRRVQEYSMAEISRFSTASLVTRATNDVMQVQFLIVMGMNSIVRAPIMAGVSFMKIRGKSWQWSAATGIAIAALLGVLGILILLTMPKFKIIQSLTDDLNRVTRENLSGLKVIRAYQAEDYQRGKFEQVNSRLTATHLFTGRSMAFLMPVIMAIMNALTLSIYWIGAVLINKAGLLNKMTIFSEMIVFIAYAMQMVMAFMMLVAIFIFFPRASVAAGRILEVLNTKSSIVDGERTDASEGLKGDIEFKDVSFRYPDGENDAIEHISFHAKPGSTVALIGSTGCGKSTVINLIPRFFDVTGGAVLVDGVDVREYRQSALRDRIGYISQNAVLFSGSISSNIAYGAVNEKKPEEEAIRRAAETAQAEEFIEQMDGTYNAIVSRGGSNLSGGQRQRVSIARALARDPEILIFDDSFSALDFKTDRQLRDALKQNYSDKTILIVAQRISTIKDADLILVLDKGRIAGSGTHAELLESCPVYRQIALSQLSEEELKR